MAGMNRQPAAQGLLDSLFGMRGVAGDSPTTLASAGVATGHRMPHRADPICLNPTHRPIV
jgi:hypothetical protein